MIYIYGYGTRVETLNLLGYEQCEACEKERRFVARMKYYYIHLYFLGLVFGRKYYAVCNICENGWALKSKEAKRLIKAGKLETPYISSLATFGIFLFPATIAIIFLLQIIGFKVNLLLLIATSVTFVLFCLLYDIKRKGIKEYFRGITDRGTPKSIIPSD